MRQICYVASIILFFIVGCSKDDPINDPNEEPKGNPTEIQNGTIDHPYLLKTKQDLVQMRDRVNNENVNYGNKVYKLMADLDFTGEPNWIPIGTSSINAFQGVFDGNGKVIKNLKIGSDAILVEMEYAGLFGYVSGGDLKNVRVQWIRINTSSNFESNSGGIVGYATGTNIFNCYTTGAISSDRNAGGIAGFLKGSNVTKCYSTGAISSSYAGGIVGQSDSQISDCYSTGAVSGNQAGGIAGSAKKIENCYSIGVITGGGIIGSTSNSIINNCYSTGSTHGGIANELKGGVITNCFSSGPSIGGGIVSYAEVGTICNCYSTSVVASATLSSYNFRSYTYSGGIVGIAFNEYDAKINVINCYASGFISATTSTTYPDSYSCAGGIIGFLIYPDEASIINCLALNSNITAISPYSPNNALAARITNYYSSSYFPVVNCNFAAPSMVVKKSKSESSTTTINDFTDIKKSGTNLTGTPLDLLNKYVMANANYEGISLIKWKVQSGINNGFPIFDK